MTLLSVEGTFRMTLLSVEGTFRMTLLSVEGIVGESWKDNKKTLNSNKRNTTNLGCEFPTLDYLWSSFS
jgi:hypothetical protein